jgi:hypothetical protein
MEQTRNIPPTDTVALDGVRVGLRRLLRQGRVNAAALLACPELVALPSSLGHSSSEAQAAVAVADALTRAVESSPHRAAARVLFGLDPTTEGLTVGARREAAAAIFEVTPDSFRVRRELPLLDEIARTLVVQLATPSKAARAPSVHLQHRHRALIGILADALAETDAWPFYPYVEAMLDHQHGLAFDDVMSDMPLRMAWAQSGYGPQSSVMASVAALAETDFNRDELEHYVAVVRYAAEAERGYLPSPQGQPELRLPADEVRRIALPEKADERRLSRLLAITEADAVLAFAGRREDDEWFLQVDRRVRTYRGVMGLDDYIERRPLPESPVAAFSVAAPVLRASPSVFIVMPFGEAWSKNVHDTIVRACDDVADLVGGLTWQRADDIAEPGRITDQIINAIETADVIVADLTGSNPNVMFELGYADAAGKPIVVLHQDVDATPFDIKDWRQIRYDSYDLEAAHAQLVAFIRGALHGRQRGA